MEPRLQRRVQRYGWNRAAEYYEDLWREQIEPAQSMLLSLVDLTGGQDVADIACGSGLVTFPAADRVGRNGSVIGTDLSEDMIRVADKAAEDRDLKNVSFRRMGAESLDLPDQSFDAVLCSLGLMYFPDPLVSMREMYRVSKPGATTAVAVWGDRKHCGWADIFPVVDARVNSDVCPMFFGLGTGGALKFTFEEAGFSAVEIVRISTVLHYQSAEEACMAAFAGGPVALAYSRFDEETREGAHAEYLESIEPYRVDDSYEIPGEFVLGVGRRTAA